MKKYLLMMGISALSFGAVKAQSQDKNNNHPGYPKDNVVYSSEADCYRDNPDTCVTCYKVIKPYGTWWYAMADFPTLKINPKFYPYSDKEDAQAAAGLKGYVYSEKESGGTWWYVGSVDQRMGKGEAGIPENKSVEEDWEAKKTKLRKARDEFKNDTADIDSAKLIMRQKLDEKRQNLH